MKVVTSAVPSLSRSALLRTVSVLIAGGAAPLATMLPAPSTAAAPPQQQMRTSSDFNSIMELTGEQSQNLGAGTISSRSRPVTGVVLLDEVVSSGKESSPTISAEMVLDGGVAITASFESTWPLAKGMFYDVESRSKGGDGAFMHVASLPSGASLETLPSTFFTDKILSAAGRFGAFGAPTDVKILSSKTLESKEVSRRELEISFNALSPGQSEVPRRALVAAVQPTGSSSVVMLVGGATAGRWKSTEPAVRKTIGSFKVSQTRSTKLKRTRASDYRFEEQGGLWAGVKDEPSAF